MKTCTGCGATKPLDHFPKASKGKFGRGAKCSQCTALWRSQHKDYLKQYNQTYYSENSDAIKKSVSEYGKRTGHAAQKLRDPRRSQARLRLMKALAAGKIAKLPCFCCGKLAQAHHPDYDRPLDVVWLCIKHHSEVHSGI
jgi:hypothetical protein